MAIILYGARKWKILNCFSLPKQWSQFSGVMEMHLKIKHVLQQQDAPLPNYIYSSNFRKQYLLSIWAVKAMILALLKQEFGTFNCIVLYYRTPGLSQTCFSAPDRHRTESDTDNWENVIWWHYSVSESVHLLRHEKERNVLMWYVLSQDYQRKYKWETMCSYIKSLSIWVSQCFAL